MGITVNEEVDEVKRKVITKTKSHFAKVYLPKEWEGREIVVCLLPKKVKR